MDACFQQSIKLTTEVKGKREKWREESSWSNSSFKVEGRDGRDEMCSRIKVTCQGEEREPVTNRLNFSSFQLPSLALRSHD